MKVPTPKKELDLHMRESEFDRIMKKAFQAKPEPNPARKARSKKSSAK